MKLSILRNFLKHVQEFLVKTIKYEKEIKGIKIGKEEVKSPFSDAMVLFIEMLNNPLKHY